MKCSRVVYDQRRLFELPNPSSVSMFEQNAASFMTRADTTSSVSILDSAVVVVNS